MFHRLAKHAGVSPTMLLALFAMLYPGMALPALPPPAVGDASAPKTDRGAGAAAPESETETSWLIPIFRTGGVLSYNIRRDAAEDQKRMQTGLIATLKASTSTFIWQPWFARANGTLGLTMSRDSSSENESSSSSKSVFLTGGGQLSVLAQSPYPFEAHFERTDSRVSNDLALDNGYVGQRFGFTQRYFRPSGDAMFGWDSSSQTSPANGRDRQDTFQLSLSHSLKLHRFQLTGNGSRNTHEISGESAMQNNLSLQHSYAPDPSFSVENMANISRAGYHLQYGDNDTNLMQLSSLAFWRPVDKPLTVNGSARMLAFGLDTTGPSGVTFGGRTRSFNANVGANYELTRFTRINANGNVNLTDSGGARTTSTSQSVSIGYQPAVINLGSFQYNWSTSAAATNQTGGERAVRQLSLQLSHNLTRNFSLPGGSSIGLAGSQGLAATAGTGSDSTISGEPTSSKQLTHSASVSWDLSRESGAATLRLGASDSRSLDGRKEFFQIINFQASSNLRAGLYSSWTGNLTLQAIRQSPVVITDPFDPRSNILVSAEAPEKGYTSSSNGSISYQNQRVFGVRRLRFVSDLRLNSEALLPLLGNAKERETAAWENRLDYSIGRTQLRMSATISRNSVPKIDVNAATRVETAEKTQRTNKSIMFSVSRSFGDF